MGVLIKEALVTAVQNGLPADEKLTKKSIETVIEGALNAISAALANGDDVRLSGVGILKPKTMAPRKCRNPKTGEALAPIGERKGVSFAISRELKATLNPDLAVKA